MLAKSMYDFRNVLHKQGVIFCYSGYVTEPVVTGIGEALKRKLVLEETDTKTMRNVFAIFVEQMQNIVRYSAECEGEQEEEMQTEIRYGVLSIGIERDKLFVACGNKVRRIDVPTLNKRLGELQTTDRDGLKSLYKQKLRAPTEETSKGAGLGFIDIARRASEIIDFDFMDLDDDYSFFCLKAYV